jgi:hypothetical protein
LEWLGDLGGVGLDFAQTSKNSVGRIGDSAPVRTEGMALDSREIIAGLGTAQSFGHLPIAGLSHWDPIGTSIANARS